MVHWSFEVLSGLFLLLAFTSRFALEFSVGQFLSVPFAFLGLLLLITAKRKA